VLASACSRSGTVNGEVVATLADGRQQRAYRIDAVLVKDAPFQRDWTRLIDDFQKDLRVLQNTIERSDAEIKRDDGGPRDSVQACRG
jgi:hypothetical protein